PPRARPSPPPPPPAPLRAPRGPGTASLPCAALAALAARVPLDAVIDVHEPAKATEPGAHEGEQRPGAKPAVNQPPRSTEQENRERERESERAVRVALAKAPAEAILIVGGHDADGNIPACEKFRKQSQNRANLCGAWEYDVLTWS